MLYHVVIADDTIFHITRHMQSQTAYFFKMTFLSKKQTNKQTKKNNSNNKNTQGQQNPRKEKAPPSIERGSRL